MKMCEEIILEDDKKKVARLSVSYERETFADIFLTSASNHLNSSNMKIQFEEKLLLLQSKLEQMAACGFEINVWKFRQKNQWLIICYFGNSLMAVRLLR